MAAIPRKLKSIRLTQPTPLFGTPLPSPKSATPSSSSSASSSSSSSLPRASYTLIGLRSRRKHTVNTHTHTHTQHTHTPRRSSSTATTTTLNSTPTDEHTEKNDLEVKDPEMIFKTVWGNLERKYGEANMAFPTNIMWLAGAPGSGKGTMLNFIRKHRGISAPSIEVSALLRGPKMEKLKSEGQLVGDRLVVEVLFDTLLQPIYETGVIVDGFPRTATQAECICMLYDHMCVLRRKYENTEHAPRFRRPIFHITVLYVEEKESVRRQLQRGQDALHGNEVVRATGVGDLSGIRPTDIDPYLARERYRQFKEQVYDSLKLIKSKFHFHFINAEGSVGEVQARIVRELSYQSQLELGDGTFDKVRKIPLASEVILNARHELVKRLDYYDQRHPDLLQEVVDVIRDNFVRIIRRQALSGKAVIRSVKPVFAKPLALDMALDLLSERGFTVVLDVKKEKVPIKFDPSNGAITCSEIRVYEFQIQFQPGFKRDDA